MAITTMTKGVVLRGILKDVKENHPRGITPIIDEIPRGIREKDFAHNIMHGVWYSYDAFTGLLEAYVRVVGRGRAGSIEELGARAAKRDLSTVLKIFAAVSSAHRVGQHAAAVWSQRFKDAGIITMVDKQDRSFRTNLEQFPEIHPLHCAFTAGYGTGIGQHWEKTFRSVHDSCIHRGASSCSWISTW